MGRMIDRSGQQFGKLTALAFSHRFGTRYFWHFRCDCGREKTLAIADVMHHGTHSCGNCREPRPPKPSKPTPPKMYEREQHGLSRTGTYKSWAQMKDRCLNPANDHYSRYGGRGISVYEEWRYSFSVFLDDMGPRPEGTTLDRINNNGNYEPGNCRWATLEEQNDNRRPRSRV